MKKKLPIFTTPEGRAKYMAAYEAMFALWKVPHDSIDVKTGYGSTHINVSGPDDGYPLVLLHAAGLSSTVWFANIAELSTNHRVYAVDVIGDAGKSVADRLMKKRTDYAKWLREVFDGLNIERGYLLGHSYGGVVNAQYGAGVSGSVTQNRFAGPGRIFPSFRFHNKTHIVSGGTQNPSPRKVYVKGGGSERDGA